MTAQELINHLEKFTDKSLQVMILDGFNAQGNKRKINFLPGGVRSITKEDIQDLGDCEYMKEGQDVILLGFGYY